MKIVYWSGTGNTEKMANLISEGISEGGKGAEVVSVDDASANIFDGEETIVLGCPAMGSEVLEECEFEPFIESIKDKVSGKKAALFGSYGWGSGEWMENFKELMESYGCLVNLEPLIIMESPEGDAEDDCREYGKKIASL
ncbi:MAG: flavodoxin [Clostridium sp.]|uniref:flavodoxin n=1 Tax=Clostridium sp. DSM 8431 TaxID=1761781 RepID=UPI0008E348EB|nr:flavodoxin [Clostridium sp. DSM 8431]MCR4945223.1 flavodoxin [Clostridium sp.]SFU76933.1 flavodoxin, short chain [Clostridium sp. DSM 8431]